MNPPRRGRAAALAAGCLGLAVIAVAAPAAHAGKNTPANPHISVSYRELLDPETIVRTRERLVDVLARPDRRDVLQPFLDPYSALLPYAVQMLYGADSVPQQDLAGRYAAGGAQPAWVAILRAGKIAVTTDGQGRARVFLPGDDPRAAYRRAYSVLRHPLSVLLPAGGQIEVEVFAYRNDYAAAELTLFTLPYRFRTKAFPPQGVPLDLAGLERLFQQEGRLEGAELAPGEGLFLYASRGPRPTLSGRPVTLADFAVAYRAVFHAGDTEAFVSLDRNADPTLAAVNFGGLLEDTRVGEVLLTADKRFKTICSGLDPVTHADIRDQTRRAVPTFLINAERSFLSNAEHAFPAERSESTAAWSETRYWYYPDSCGVETDAAGLLAVVSRDRFSADVERLGAAAGAQSNSGGRLIARESIRDLNQNYDRYATAFPEVRELSTVARLMAIASWLRRVRPAWLDLDGLLAVDLPPASTPRSLQRLMSLEMLPVFPERKIDREYVQKHTVVRYLNPELDKTVGEVFRNPQGIGVFLAYRAGKPLGDGGAFYEQAERLFADRRDQKVRELVRTNEDLRALLRVISTRILEGIPVEGLPDADRDRQSFERIAARLQSLRAGTGGADAAADAAEIRALDEEYAAILRKYHTQAAKSKEAAGIRLTNMQYTGGVSMDPRLFSVKRSTSSPAIEKIRAASRSDSTQGGGSGWIRSGNRSAAPGASAPPAVALPGTTGTAAGNQRPPGPPAPGGVSTPRGRPAVPPAPASTTALPGLESPAEIAVAAPRTAAMRTIVLPPEVTPGGAPIVGRLEHEGRIVFGRAGR